ncbi:DUF1566 domain-containing protein [Hydrogenophaga sp. RWCD_12]|uniref:Lcl domain-containing protein n=1 Tax=Hydrogenophaga sp. RWCD_12 TaxID=3391190 RepID=UPI00398550F7
MKLKGGNMRMKESWRLLVLVGAALVSGCGGSDRATTETPANGSTTTAFSAKAPADLEHAGAQLNLAELTRASQRAAPGNARSFGHAKAFSSPTVNVFRFFNRTTGAHFYTSSESEKATVQATNPLFAYEGVAFVAGTTNAGGLSPVYRFYNQLTGVHFYTISEDEKSFVQANRPEMLFEGVAYYASMVGGKGLVPLNRFYQSSKGFHFYTNSEAETARVRKSLPQYHYEGASYYVSGPEVAVTHTAMTEDDCYEAGSDTLVSCSSAGALALSPHQDGHRSNYNRMAFSELTPGGDGAGYLPRDCITDEVTGLVWEGFGAHGDVEWAVYTNFLNPLLGDVNAYNNAAAYVGRINALALCGYSDWRMPDINEVGNLVSHNGAVARQPEPYGWTSVPFAPDTRQAWAFTGSDGGMVAQPFGQDNLRYVAPLVRGAPAAARSQSCPSSTSRFVPNGSEALDTESGLTWSRCSVGQTWSGSTCVGDASLLTHEEALAMAPDGWRLPNAKELASLVDWGCSVPAIDRTVFPATTPAPYWSSTPWKVYPHTGHFSPPAPVNTSTALAVDFYYGATDSYPRATRRLPLRWVRLGS